MNEAPQQAQKPKETPEYEKSHARSWTRKIKNAKEKWEPDFKRMREDMNFAFGIQWPGQKNLTEEQRYSANLVIREVNQKVSTLYARDPKAIAKRRKRLDYVLWDGKVETLVLMLQRASAGDPEAMAVIADYQHGQQWRDMVDRVCRSLEVIYQYNVDSIRPGFKQQMKQLVRRVVTCGVGYVVLGFERNYEGQLQSSATHSTILERGKSLEALLEKVDKGEIDENSDKVQRLALLMQSLAHSIQSPLETAQVSERLTFDFPTSTSIIVDPNCRSLKGFIGARWLAREFILPVDFVNAQYETDIKASEITAYNSSGEELTKQPEQGFDAKESNACIWDVQDLDTKTHFVVCDGYKDYVVSPEENEPQISRFWTVFPLSYNDSEVESSLRATIFPPSDVTLMRHAQLEWNRSREALRDHRIAKLPRLVVSGGALSDQDKENLQKGENSIIDLQNLPPGTDINKVLQTVQYPPVDPAVYQTQHLSEDIQLTVGAQSANLGPAQPNVTATVGTIAEQSRMTTSSSNVDDLDDMLSELAQSGGEVIMQEFSEETVKRIGGNGAVWPQQNRADFINEIFLDIVAASAGRPNKAIEVANAERLIPLLMQFGANPQPVIREIVKRLDDQLEPEEFFPLPLPPVMAPPGGPPPAGPQPGQPGPLPPMAQGGPAPAQRRRGRRRPQPQPQ